MTALAQKHAWEMTLAEYFESDPDIVVRMRVGGFQADHGLQRSAAGVSRRAMREFQKLHAARFAASAPAMEVARVVKPNPDLESNMAAVRRDHRRAVTKAVMAGLPVPAVVLADYPELQP